MERRVHYTIQHGRAQGRIELAVTYLKDFDKFALFICFYLQNDLLLTKLQFTRAKLFNFCVWRGREGTKGRGGASYISDKLSSKIRKFTLLQLMNPIL